MLNNVLMGVQLVLAALLILSIIFSHDLYLFLSINTITFGISINDNIAIIAITIITSIKVNPFLFITITMI